MAPVELAQARTTFGSTRVLGGVDIAIADGEFVVLVGPSGSANTPCCA